jgi:predicted transcriptional regulator
MLSDLNLPAWFDVLVLLNGIDSKQNYYQNLLKKTPIASSHIRCIIALLKKRNLIKEQSTCKIKYLSLTESGKQLAQHISQIKGILKNGS